MGKNIFLLQDLAIIFADEAPRTLKKSIDRLIKADLLVRITKGIYANALASPGPYPLESIAINIRRGEYSYISLDVSVIPIWDWHLNPPQILPFYYMDTTS
ncbi:hypothetical protein [Xenorhabdus littoralis]|uniref:hypothetical protein n=1 Tax=Xenorhabdus littoralis TaxID=2582835 RepID=UPI0029E819EA|nr:hypothetical protein [Xenorhabdus sp. Reich]